MMRTFAAMILLAALATTEACLVEDVHHTLYLDPDGALTWTVLEQRVRSDARDREERLREEETFARDVANEEHPVARALAALGPWRLETHRLRDARPYSVMTEARFDRVDDLALRLLDALELDGDARLEADGDLVRLTVSFRSEGDREADESVDEESPVLALADSLDSYTIVLTRGRFVAAEGFEIGSDGATATPLAADDEADGGGEITLSLTWTVEEP